MLKTCTKCGRSHPYEYFPKYKNSTDGLFCWCKDCVAIRNRLYWNSSNKSLSNDGYVELARMTYFYNNKNGTLIKHGAVVPSGSMRKNGYIYVMLNKKKLLHIGLYG